MWPPVDVEALVSRWRPLTQEEQTVAEARIEDAEAEVQYQLQQRGVLDPPADTLWVKLYTSTVVEMVRRFMLNPDGWVEETERLDDWSETKRRGTAVASGALYISDVELAKLVPANRRRRGAFSIRLGTT